MRYQRPAGLDRGPVPEGGRRSPALQVCYHCGSGLPEHCRGMRFTSATERRVFTLLLSKLGEVVPHAQLHGDRNSLQVAISRLRAMLREEGRPYAIETEYGEGYMLLEDIPDGKA